MLPSNLNALSRNRSIMVALAKKDAAMKQFGTVNSFNEASGHGSIRPDNGGSDLGFESSDLSFIGFNSPKVGQRMSYHVSGKHGHASAVDVRLALIRTQSQANSTSALGGKRT